MKPLYYPDIFSHSVEEIWTNIPWIRVAPRDECWMNDFNLDYTYGSGIGARTYNATPISDFVRTVLNTTNELLGSTLDVCFINGYRDNSDALGWHSDNSPEVSNDAPIAVVSFGAEREIWWREFETKGVVPEDCRQKLGNGSLFVMPAGFQTWGEHRIPKHSANCGKRISLTFRKYYNSN